METRIYLINLQDEAISKIDDVAGLSDEQFIQVAEEQENTTAFGGGCYSLNGFAEAFNSEEMPYETSYMRIITTCRHSFIDADNEGCYGNEICRYCGFTQHS